MKKLRHKTSVQTSEPFLELHPNACNTNLSIPATMPPIFCPIATGDLVPVRKMNKGGFRELAEFELSLETQGGHLPVFDTVGDKVQSGKW